MVKKIMQVNDRWYLIDNYMGSYEPVHRATPDEERAIFDKILGGGLTLIEPTPDRGHEFTEI